LFVLRQVLHHKSTVFHNVFVFVRTKLAQSVLQIGHKFDVLLAENSGLLYSQLHFLEFPWVGLGLKFSAKATYSENVGSLLYSKAQHRRFLWWQKIQLVLQ